MKEIFIYGLHTNNSEKIRYIGKCSDINYRLKMHYSQRNSSKTHKNNWINKIIRDGEELRIKVLEVVNIENWQEKEKEWINKFENLTNTSEGGLGGSGRKYNISYTDCKNIISKFDISSRSKWIEFTKSIDFPKNIPKNPTQYFKKKWLGWGDFLGTNRKQDNLISDIYISYEDAKEWLRYNIKVTSSKEWKKNISIIPNNIPNRPDRFYQNRGWISWSDFLGKERVANQKRKILTYEQAKKTINDLNITSIKEYKKIQSDKYVNELPVHPHLTYKNKGFINYEEFFKRL